MMKKLFAAGCLAMACLSMGSAAQAKTLRLFYNIFGLPPSIIKPVGPARGVNGVIEDGQVFFRQDFIYLRTGVLIHDLKPPSDTDRWRDFFLPAGTVFYALTGDEDSDWCSVPEPHYKSSCIAHDESGYYWAPERPPRLDAGRWLDFSYLKTGQTAVFLGKDALIDETVPVAPIIETFEISYVRIKPYQFPPGFKPKHKIRPQKVFFNFKLISGRTGLAGAWLRSEGLYVPLLSGAVRHQLKGGLDIYGQGDVGTGLSYDPDTQTLNARQIKRGGK